MVMKVESPAVDDLAKKLGTFYNQKGSWEDYTTDQRKWNAAVIDVLRRAAPFAGPPVGTTYLSPPRPCAQKPSKPQPTKEYQRNPAFNVKPIPTPRPQTRNSEQKISRVTILPRKANPNLPPYQRSFLQRISLLDKSKNILIGDSYPTTKLVQTEIKSDGNIVGWLSIAAPNIEEDPLTSAFFSRQLTLSLWVACIGAAIATLVSFIFSRHITSPILKLRSAAAEISKRNFKSHIQIDTSDELNDLAVSFNQISKELLNYEIRQKRWLMDISHELRTPLTILLGETDAMIDGIYECKISSIRSLQEEALQVKRLVDDLHELSMMERIGFQLNFSPIEFNEFVKNHIAKFEDILKQQKIDIEFTPDSMPAPLIGDINRLAQVIQNILQNSSRYTQSPGKLFIKILQTEKEVSLFFDDTGPGVPADGVHHLFDPLYRTDSSRSRSTGGAGLGLAICKNIISAHKGCIAASQSLLGGLRLHISLPKAEGTNTL